MNGKQLTIEQAAKYLHITPSDITKLICMGEIASTGDSRRPLFSTEELDAWASKRIMGMGEKKLAVLDKENIAKHRNDPFSLADIITEDRIFLDLDAKTKSSVISGVVEEAEELGLLYNPKDLLESLRAREELCSTGLPGGIAILHPRNHDPYLASESFLLLSRTNSKVHFGAPDGKPTDLFFTLVCHEDKIHLRALARICMVASNALVLEQIRASSSPFEIRSILLAAEHQN